eukprot:11947982-Alexandrium_andersonii.AAC.1
MAEERALQTEIADKKKKLAEIKDKKLAEERRATEEVKQAQAAQLAEEQAKAKKLAEEKQRVEEERQAETKRLADEVQAARAEEKKME